MKKIIPATKYDYFLLKAGSYLKIIDVEGGQVADLTAFKSGEVTEWLSNGRSFDYEETIFFSTDNTLYSNKSRPMLTIVEDSVGRHDFLYTPCSTEMYRLQYGIEGSPPNCLDNLRLALAAAGQEPPEIPTSFNVFMNVELSPEGRLNVRPPLSKKGDHLTFRAEIDCVIAISACPSINCNGGTQKPVGYEIE